MLSLLPARAPREPSSELSTPCTTEVKNSNGRLSGPTLLWTHCHQKGTPVGGAVCCSGAGGGGGVGAAEEGEQLSVLPA